MDWDGGMYEIQILFECTPAFSWLYFVVSLEAKGQQQTIGFFAAWTCFELWFGLNDELLFVDRRYVRLFT